MNNIKIRRRNILSYFLFLLIGLFAVFHPTILSGFSMIQTDLGDTRFNNYVLEHGFQWISGNPIHQNFWSPPFFYPVANVAAYSDILLGAAPFYWAIRFIGIQSDTSFQLWMMVVLALNYLTMLFFLKRGLGLSTIASIGGAYLFAFASPRVCQLGHQQLIPQFYSVIACYSLSQVFESPGNRFSHHSNIHLWTAFLVSSTVLQIFAGFYLGWFFCFGIVVFSAFAMFFTIERQHLSDTVRENWVKIIAWGSAGMTALMWMVYHYSQAPTSVRPWHEVASMIPHFMSWIDFGPSNWAWGWTRQYTDVTSLPIEQEHRIGLGIIASLVILLGLKPLWEKRWGKPLILATGFALFLAMVYPFSLSPWKVVYQLFPGAGAIRGVTRICLLLLIPFSVLLAMGLDRIQNKLVAICLVLAMCGEQLVTTEAYDKSDARKDATQIAEGISPGCSSFYYAKVLRPGESSCPRWKYQLDAMTAQLICNKPTLNGYSGQEPPNWILLGEPIVRSRFEIAALKRRVYNWTIEIGLDPNSVGIIYDREVSDLPHWVNDTAEKVELTFGISTTRPFLTKGWSGDEQNENMSWVWANNLESELFVPLQNASSYELILSVEPLQVPNLIQDVTLSLNGVVVNHFELHQDLQTYKTYLPAELVSEVNLIQFKFNYAISPASLEGSHDTRKLAALFHKVTFVPKANVD